MKKFFFLFIIFSLKVTFSQTINTTSNCCMSDTCMVSYSIGNMLYGVKSNGDIILNFTEPKVFNVATSIKNDKFISLTVFPNPSKDIITLEIPDINTEIKYELIGLNGNILLNGEFYKRTNIDLTEIKSGSYIIKIKSKNIEKVIKIIVEK